MKHIYIIKCKKCGMERERGSAKLGLCRKCYRALPENKEKENAYSRMWYIKHRESEIEKNREYRKMNRELFDWYHNKDRFGGFRKMIIERDGGMCISCKTKEKLTVHHIDGTNYRKGNANNNPDNLITLCNKCHSFLHQHQKRIGRILSREDIVRTLVKAKEMFRNERPLYEKTFIKS